MIRVWHVAQSRSFRVLWALEEIGVEYDLIQCSFLDKSLRSPEHMARSPAGRVPALELEGKTLCESGAILLYLAERLAPELRIPEGDTARGAFLQRLHYAETLGAHLVNLTQQHIMLREEWMRSPTLMRLEAMRLERAIAGCGAEVTADTFTVADIALGYSVYLARRFVSLPDNAVRYLDTLTPRPAFQRALNKDGPAQIYLKEFYAPPNSDMGG